MEKRGRHEHATAPLEPGGEPTAPAGFHTWWLWAALPIGLAVMTALIWISNGDPMTGDAPPEAIHASPETTAPPALEGPTPALYPYGPHVGSSGGWDLVDDMFTSAHFNPSRPDEVLLWLNQAQAEGRSVILLLAGPASQYKNDDGTFSIDMWKDKIDLYGHLDLDPWIEDGTIFVHYLISEPMSRSRWGGQVIPAETIDEMAAYSKQYWPNLPTVAREQPTDLIRHAGGYDVAIPGWTWSHLDASWARYRASKGQIDDFIADEMEAAREQELGLLFGMNVLQGGDGSSDLIGYNDDWVMSADELLEYGEKLISAPYGCAMLMWHLNFDDIVYFELPEIATAMSHLAEVAMDREPRTCVGR